MTKRTLQPGDRVSVMDSSRGDATVVEIRRADQFQNRRAVVSFADGEIRTYALDRLTKVRSDV